MIKSRIIITGGSGFIGTNLVDYYLARDCHVLNLDHLPPRNPAHLNYWQKVDILRFNELKSAIS